MYNYGKVKLGCYGINITMAAVANLSPLLFITFHNEYDISFTALGLLVLLNFSTQLLVDLVFSFFSEKLSAHMAIRITPPLSALGLLIYALSPFIFKGSPYAGIVIGTVVASVASGLAEVLMSALIAAIPSDNPDSEMSKLHSVYAWGVVAVIMVSTVFLLVTGGKYWYLLPAAYALIPVVCTFFFLTSKLPPMQGERKDGVGAGRIIKNKGVLLCIVGIFLAGASECTMAQWCSSFAEEALGIPKVVGDILGAAAFALMMGIGRTLYTKRGKRIEHILLFGIIGCAVCYIVAAICPIGGIGLAACAICGLCASMLWPGCIIAMNEKAPSGGVFVYAVMAASGDLGASVGPQLVGFITDTVAASDFAFSLSESLSVSPETVGMKAGILIAAIFPLLGIAVFATLFKDRKKELRI